MAEGESGRRCGQVTLTADADEFMLAVPGASGSLVRTGRGRSMTSVTTRDVGPASLAVLQLGFPMVGNAEADDDVLVLCHMLHTPPSGSWDGVALEAGQTFVYPPGTAQAAIDPDGLTFGLISIRWSDVEDAAATLGHEVRADTPAWMHPPDDGRALRPLFTSLLTADAPTAGGSTEPEERADEVDDLLGIVVHAACEDPRLAGEGRPGGSRGWTSDELTRDAIEFLVESNSWRVPILRLCHEVGVSERRLLTAFKEQYGLGPQRFMHHRAMQGANRALVEADPAVTTVAAVAAAHGFAHGGRFAQQYRTIFGEPPSVTLTRTRG